jgi:hypothetical protein
METGSGLPEYIVYPRVLLTGALPHFTSILCIPLTYEVRMKKNTRACRVVKLCSTTTHSGGSEPGQPHTDG